VRRCPQPRKMNTRPSLRRTLKAHQITLLHSETGPLSSTRQHRQTYFITGKSRQGVLLRLVNGRRTLVIKATHWAIRSPIVRGGAALLLRTLGRNSSRPKTLVIPHQRGRTSNKLPKSLNNSISSRKNGTCRVVIVILTLNINVISSVILLNGTPSM